jgi:hypothetical protein
LGRKFHAVYLFVLMTLSSNLSPTPGTVPGMLTVKERTRVLGSVSYRKVFFGRMLTSVDKSGSFELIYPFYL